MPSASAASGSPKTLFIADSEPVLTVSLVTSWFTTSLAKASLLASLVNSFSTAAVIAPVNRALFAGSCNSISTTS